MYIPGKGLISRKKLLENVIYSDFERVKNNKKIEYYNVPAAFDIEVTSFYNENGEKRALMYIWQFGINNCVTTGRTWDEFTELLNFLRKILCLNDNRRLVVYVHNLPYEFQFIKKRFKWHEVFLLDDRKPVYCDENGIEYRCSYKLSNKSLANVAKDLIKYPTKKLVGDLDYKIMRTPLTPLTSQELTYCENDIRILLHYIQEKIEQDGDITKIPLTMTGYVRQYCRKACYKRWKKYRNLMNELTLEPEEYSQLKKAFQGGFTHANAKYVGQTLENVGSHDITSSYPAVMVLEKFPMSKAKYIRDSLSGEELLRLLKTKCCLFDIRIVNAIPRLHQDHVLSKSKCYVCDGAIIDNGRVVGADLIMTKVTEQDYWVLSEFYDWDYIEVYNFRYYEKGYLPKPFVLAVLYMYGKKTTLKGVIGEEVNYAIFKEMVNAIYGMSVTDIIRKLFKFNGKDCVPVKRHMEEEIERYNKDVKRFLFYPWGVWITSYARANLFSAIIALGDDYVYADTDSTKHLNSQKHEQYFKNYNDSIMKKIKKAAEYHHIDESLFMPKTDEGVIKPIGVWEDEGIYEKFKTLGAKRYLTFKRTYMKLEEDDGVTVQLTRIPEYTATIAGANKAKASAYLRTTKKPFENFTFDTVIPKEYSGRLLLTYIDEETEGDVVDCFGTPYHYHELSSIHMEETEYTLNISESFESYLRGIENWDN